MHSEHCMPYLQIRLLGDSASISGNSDTIRCRISRIGRDVINILQAPRRHGHIARAAHGGRVIRPLDGRGARRRRRNKNRSMTRARREPAAHHSASETTTHWGYGRGCGVHEVNVRSQLRRDRVSQRPDCLETGLLVREHGEVRGK